MAIYLGALQACGLGIRVRRSRRIEMPFFPIPDGTQHLAGVNQRTQLADLGGRDEFRLEPQHAMAGPISAQKVPALWGSRDIESTREVQADVLARNALNFLIERNGVPLKLWDSRVAVEGIKSARRMPTGAGRQLLSFAEHDVSPSLLCEMVQNAAADDAATDDDGTDVTPQARTPRRHDSTIFICARSGSALRWSMAACERSTPRASRQLSQVEPQRACSQTPAGRT